MNAVFSLPAQQIILGRALHQRSICISAIHEEVMRLRICLAHLMNVGAAINQEARPLWPCDPEAGGAVGAHAGVD